MDANHPWSLPLTSPSGNKSPLQCLRVDASSQIRAIEEALADSALADEFMCSYSYEGRTSRPANSSLGRDSGVDHASTDHVRAVAENNAGSSNSQLVATRQQGPEPENTATGRGGNATTEEDGISRRERPELGGGDDIRNRDLEPHLHQSRLRPSPPHREPSGRLSSTRDPAVTPEDATSDAQTPRQAATPATEPATTSAGRLLRRSPPRSLLNPPGPGPSSPPSPPAAQRQSQQQQQQHQHRPEPHPPQSQVIQFQIVDSEQFAIRFSIRRHRPLGRAMRIFSDRSGRIFDTLRFMHELQRVHESSSPDTVSLSLLISLLPVSCVSCRRLSSCYLKRKDTVQSKY